MSTIYSALNGLVFAAICVAGIFYFSQAHDYGRPNDAWFESAVIDQPEPVLVKFGAEWCPPCKAMEPELDQLQAKLQGRAGVVRINVDQHPNLAQHYGVSSIPRLLLFNHGKVVGDRVGFLDQKQLQSWIASKAQ
jgi:thioredoxin 1